MARLRSRWSSTAGLRSTSMTGLVSPVGPAWHALKRARRPRRVIRSRDGYSAPGSRRPRRPLPILTFGTEITPVGRVRTRRRALERMGAYLDELHDRGATDWIVQHAQSSEDAEHLVAHGWVPSTGPTSVQNSGPVPKIAVRSRRRRLRAPP